MKNEEIYSVVTGGKIYFVDESGNLYDQIVTRGTGMKGLGFISRLRDVKYQIADSIASNVSIDAETAAKIKQSIANMKQFNSQTTSNSNTDFSTKVQKGAEIVEKVGDTYNNLLNNNKPFDPNNSGVVQSGANVNDAGQVYQNAGMNIDFNNKWVMIGGGLLAVGVVFWFINNSGNKEKATKKAK